MLSGSVITAQAVYLSACAVDRTRGILRVSYFDFSSYGFKSCDALFTFLSVSLPFFVLFVRFCRFFKFSF